MITLCVLLWPHAGQEQSLADYETRVLALLDRYDSRVISRVSNAAYTDQLPYEVQIIELPDQGAMDAYLKDPDRTALGDLRDRSVARTEIMHVDQILR